MNVWWRGQGGNREGRVAWRTGNSSRCRDILRDAIAARRKRELKAENTLGEKREKAKGHHREGELADARGHGGSYCAQKQ